MDNPGTSFPHVHHISKLLVSVLFLIVLVVLTILYSLVFNKKEAVQTPAYDVRSVIVNDLQSTPAISISDEERANLLRQIFSSSELVTEGQREFIIKQVQNN